MHIVRTERPGLLLGLLASSLLFASRAASATVAGTTAGSEKPRLNLHKERFVAPLSLPSTNFDRTLTNMPTTPTPSKVAMHATKQAPDWSGVTFPCPTAIR